MPADSSLNEAPRDEQLRQKAETYWQGVLQRNPIVATFFGDYRYNDRLPDIGPDGRAADVAALTDVLSYQETVSPETLSATDRVSWDMLRQVAHFGLQATRLRMDEMAVDQMDGPQVWLPDLLNWHPTDTPEHVEQLITRFRAFPRYIDQYLANLEDGIRDRRTSTQIVVERVAAQLRALLAQPVEESRLLPKGSAAAAAAGTAAVAAVRDAVYPAYQRLLDFLDGSGAYLRSHARTDPGLWSVTDGAELYALLARHHTTTNLTPEELHQLGLDDLTHIQGEMREIMRSLGDASGDIRAFTERATHDPANTCATREEIVDRCEQHLTRAQAALPGAFGRLPRVPCIVRPVEDYREKDAVAAFYYQPAADGSRPGIFYVNIFEPQSRPRHTLPALVFHEAVPGHHLQIGLSQEARDLPSFRRLGAGAMANAFVEGWALYTERLSDELGLYPDALARFGMLGYQAWRACRLVVDTGIHHFRWSRQQAIDFFFQNVGLTERETVNEVDRYILWPGQALSYKTGQLEIQAQRRRAEEALGRDFDLRNFHDEILRHGALPLSSLRLVVDAWLAGRAAPTEN